VTAGQTPVRVRTGHVAWVGERLSERDWAIARSVNRLHLVTGPQLERLHFADLATSRARTVSRSRTLARLAAWRVLTVLPRRIGGTRRGSAVSVYALDTAGYHLLRQHAPQHLAAGRVRRPGAPSERWVRHILATTELYVELVEAERAGRLRLRSFQTEPGAWWPNGLGGYLKPDAYVVVSNGRVDHLWWIEVDLATEWMPAMRRKLRTYLEFVDRGGLGPRRTIPRVLVSVPSQVRLTAIRELAVTLPPPATNLFQIEIHTEAVNRLTRLLATASAH
jgi:hypothetical protein